MSDSKINPPNTRREMADIKKYLGEVIKNLRLESNLSQEQLAARCGLQRPYIGIIERGGKAITVETASRLAEGLGVKLSTIFSRVEDISSDRESKHGIKKDLGH
jgi:transcriptional regulator with XRE-family HTH domain